MVSKWAGGVPGKVKSGVVSGRTAGQLHHVNDSRKGDGERLQPSGDEAGTPPGDRRLRPDVQGFRAIAILLALLYHAGIAGFGGGYVGIEVFFVISGFVITGLLLRDREATGHTSLRSFYGRRARRIIPMATVVIIVTVIVTYHSVGPLVGHETAVDGKWADLFLGNVHYAATDTNYLVSQAPPSPLLELWSLGVEEQFYIVYPTVFLLMGWWADGHSSGFESPSSSSPSSSPPTPIRSCSPHPTRRAPTSRCWCGPGSWPWGGFIALYSSQLPAHSPGLGSHGFLGRPGGDPGERGSP